MAGREEAGRVVSPQAQPATAIAELQHLLIRADCPAAKTPDNCSSFPPKATGTQSAASLTRLLYRWSSIVQSNELQRFNF
jgi:hypothetical protein